jgi:hypothetical protein
MQRPPSGGFCVLGARDCGLCSRRASTQRTLSARRNHERLGPVLPTEYGVARSLGPLEKTRAFEMTPNFLLGYFDWATAGRGETRLRRLC